MRVDSKISSLRIDPVISDDEYFEIILLNGRILSWLLRSILSSICSFIRLRSRSRVKFPARTSISKAQKNFIMCSIASLFSRCLSFIIKRSLATSLITCFSILKEDCSDCDQTSSIIDFLLVTKSCATLSWISVRNASKAAWICGSTITVWPNVFSLSSASWSAMRSSWQITITRKPRCST